MTPSVVAPPDTLLLLFYALLAVVALVVLIAKYKLHPFIVLVTVSLAMGVAAGMPLPTVVKAFQDGVGSSLGFIAIVVGLGTMLGKMMAESGGAARIARTLIGVFGEARVHWAIMFVAFIVGIPVFFQVGFVLLIPLVFTIARQTGTSLIKIGIPLVAGLSVVHGMVPPHPAAMLAVTAFKADVGLTIVYALLVGLPTAALAGPVFASWVAPRIHLPAHNPLANQFVSDDTRVMPGFAITVFTVLLPVLLMLCASTAEIALDAANPVRYALAFIGNPIVSLLVALLFSFWSLGRDQQFNREQLLKFMNDCLSPTATILLVIGAGGGFNRVLIESGVGRAIADVALHALTDALLGAIGDPSVPPGVLERGLLLRLRFELDHHVRYVDVDNTGGGRMAAEYLLSIGRRRIATIAGPQDMSAGLDRLQGWSAALADAGLAGDAVAFGDFTADGGARAATQLLAAHKASKPSLIYAGGASGATATFLNSVAVQPIAGGRTGWLMRAALADRIGEPGGDERYRLEVEVDERDPASWSCLAPTHRPDLQREVDLIDELLRHHGLDHVPSQASVPREARAAASADPMTVRSDRVADGLREAGLQEIVSLAFVAEDKLRHFAAETPEDRHVRVANPMRGAGVMRTHLLPGLLDADQVTTLLKQRQADQLTARRGRAKTAEVRAEADHRRLTELRKELSALVSAWARRSGQPHGTVHTELRRRGGGPEVALASVTQLEERVSMVRGWFVGKR